MRLLLSLLVFFLGAPAMAATPKVLDIGSKVQVWFQEDHTVPMVAMTIALPAGSVYDPPNKLGLAAFSAYMLNQGAGDMRWDAYQGALADKAIQLSITPDRDYLIVSIATLSSNFKDAVRLLGLALRNPRMDGDATSRVRAQIIESLAEDGQDPTTQATNRFYALFFGNHPYGHSVNGNLAGVAAISPRDLKLFTGTHWVKGGAKVAVAGDVGVVALIPLLKTMFDPLPEHEPPLPSLVRHYGGPELSVLPMNVPQSVIVFGFAGLRRAEPDYLSGYVANHIVGSGDFSARLTDEVREKRGLAYSISTDYGAYRQAGYIVGQVATKNASVAQTIGIIRKVLTDYAANGPTASELADAKTYLTGSFPLAFDSDVDIASQLNAFQREGLSIGYVGRRNALVQALSLDDVKRAANRLFDPSHMIVVVVGASPLTKKSPSEKR